MPPKRNRKDTPIRWSLKQAAAEFGYARETVKRRFIGIGIAPGPDECYSTRQVTSALFGDSSTADTRRKMAEADLAELDRDEKEEKLLPVVAVESVWLEALSRIKDVIMANPMADETRRAIIKSLQVIPLSEYREAKARADEGDPSAES